MTSPIIICYTILAGKFVLRDQEHTNKECDSSFHKNTDTEIKLKKSHLVPSKLLKIGQNPAWEFLNFFSGPGDQTPDFFGPDADQV